MLAGEDEQERTVAAAMAWMPAAAAFVALAGPQVLGEEREAGVPGQMGQGRGPCGASLEGFGSEAALGADEARALRLGP
ncbi:hypothetical protein DNK56_34110 [Streptomyces sp. AC1-42W]|nr:hypothetical protein DNK55_30965 [Streptomyces sp. AC1-42T]PZT71802.1 hypothetical protein DNK55_32275 [Streptomyces sp. AC1-42T]PZT73073.1 hypothetical protein DNK56_32800 [Streptomyces sp. AC1-42W]PZT73280.1 hypothetical protein DNK56_34110 [Streptomyces sp. AC1-42W]